MYSLIIFLIAFPLYGIIELISEKLPTEDDVLAGKAEYQEVWHINHNDTIKTYKIVWKDETPSSTHD